MKCPYCGCEAFYCKDPDDPYETYEFCFEDGQAAFQDPDTEAPEVDAETEIFCNQCTWHGKQQELG